MNLSKYKAKGFTGLENLGNTCFLNSCLQVLNHTYEFHEILNMDKHKNIKKNIPDVNILNEWNDLRNVMWSGNGVVVPTKFVHNVQKIANIKNKEIFTGWAQNDMPEFLLFVMECLHNSLSRCINMRISGNVENSIDKVAVKCYDMLKDCYAKEYSEIMDMFYGVYISETTSIDGLTSHMTKPESYFILDLPIYEGNQIVTNLYDCFKLYIKPEFLEGDNAWFNENTGKKEDIKKQMTFWNFPKVLVIVLKRFTPDGTNKINNLIDFPLKDLDLSKFVRGYNASSHIYDLYGICNHIGGVTGGHYTSFVKNYDDTWIHYNDTDVEIVQTPENIITPMAYCLFYRKKNNLL